MAKKGKSNGIGVKAIMADIGIFMLIGGSCTAGMLMVEGAVNGVKKLYYNHKVEKCMNAQENTNDADEDDAE